MVNGTKSHISRVSSVSIYNISNVSRVKHRRERLCHMQSWSTWGAHSLHRQFPLSQTINIDILRAFNKPFKHTMSNQTRSQICYIPIDTIMLFLTYLSVLIFSAGALGSNPLGGVSTHLGKRWYAKLLATSENGMVLLTKI